MSRQLLTVFAKFVFLLSSVCGTASAAELINWSEPEFIARNSAEVGVADFDKDGHVDIAISASQQRWYAGPDFDTFYVLGDSDGGPYAATVADVNQDGWPDFISSDGERTGSDTGELYVYLNPAEGGDPKITEDWQRITVYSGAVYHQNDLRVLDVDGDGKLDIIERTWASERVLVALQGATLNDWVVRVFDTGETGKPEGISAGDITGDGKIEIVLSGVYWSNSDWRTAQPVEHLIDSNFQGSTFGKVKSAVGDIDKDGDIDVYMGSAEGSDRYLAWYENQGLDGNGSTNFTRHIIKDNFGKCHMVQLVDIDQDGDLDLATGRSFGENGILVFYNEYTPNEGVSWTEQNHDADGEIYTGVVADLDKDQDLDVVGPSKFYGGNVRIYRNLTPVDPITLSQTDISLSNAAASTQVTVTSEPSWVAQSDANWLSILPAAGAGVTTASVAVTANQGFVQRFGTLTFNNGSAVQTLSVTQGGIPDTQAPTMPTNLQALSVSYDRVNIAWDAASDNSGSVAQYIVYSGVVELGRSPNPAALIGGLQSETTYQLQVSALDAVGNESARSSAISIETTIRPPSEPPIFYWRLDEEPSDLTTAEAINNQTYNLVGMSGNEWQSGLIDNALAFNQSDNDDRIELGTINIASEELTLSAWIRPNNLAEFPEGRILAKASGISENDHYWMLSTIQVGSAYLPRVRLLAGGSVTTLVGNSAFEVTEDSWSHIAASYGSGVLRLFLNGEEVGSVAKSGAIGQSNSVPATIGNIPAGNRDLRAFAGLIDEVCIFDVALSNNDVTAIFNNGNAAKCDNFGQADEDTIAPVITEKAAVVDPTTESSPQVVISSDEVASVSFGGDCAFIADVQLDIGDNIITLGPFNFFGLIDSCRLTATDQSNNTAMALILSAFTIIEPDTTGPEVSINQDAQQADPTSSNLVVFTALFNEPINTASFSANDIVLLGTLTGAVTNGPFNVSNGQEFSFSVTGLANGETVQAFLPEGRVQDLAGNSNQTSTSIDNSVRYECVECTLDDPDNDGIDASIDNCPNDANADQADRDGNGIGDVCDTEQELCLPIKAGQTGFSVICL